MQTELIVLFQKSQSHFRNSSLSANLIMEQLKAAFNCDERLWMPAYLQVWGQIKSSKIITNQIRTHFKIDFLFERIYEYRNILQSKLVSNINCEPGLLYFPWDFKTNKCFYILHPLGVGFFNRLNLPSSGFSF